MSTQGLVTVVSGGRVVLKLVAGCNGSRAKEVAIELAKGTLPPISLQNVYQMCIEKSFGCERCLVVYNNDTSICEDELPERYRETFHIPGFNPRWAKGTAEYNVLVDTDLKRVYQEQREKE